MKFEKKKLDADEHRLDTDGGGRVILLICDQICVQSVVNYFCP